MTWGARGGSANAERLSVRSRAANTALFKTRRTTNSASANAPRQSVEIHEAIADIPKSRQMLEKMKQILEVRQTGRVSAPRLSGASTPRRSRGGMNGEDLLPRTPPPTTICPDQSAANVPAAAVMERPARGRVAVRMQMMMQLLEQEEDTRYRILCRQSEEWIRISQCNGVTLSLSQEQILEEVAISAGIHIAANTALPRDSVAIPSEEEMEAIRSELAVMQPKELRGLLRQSGQNPSGCDKTMRDRIYQLMACGAIEPLQVSIQMKTECASPPRRSYRKHKNEESVGGVGQATARAKSPSPEAPAVVFPVPTEEETEAIRVTLNETAVKQLRVFMRERKLNPAGSAADLRDRLLKLIASGAAEPIPVTAAAMASAPEPSLRPVKRNRNAESQPAHAPPAPTPPPAEATWVQRHPQPSPTEMQGMRRTLVTLPARLLREKLRAAGLTPAGGERELRERLEKAVASGVAAPLPITDESGIPPTPRTPQECGVAPPPAPTMVVPVEEDTAPPPPKYVLPSAEELEEARQGITALPARLLRERLRAAGLNPAGADAKLRERLYEAIGEGMAPLLKQKAAPAPQRRLSNKDRNASSMDLGMSSEQKQPQPQQQQQQQQISGERSTEEKVRALKEMTLNQIRPLLRKSGLNPAGSGESLRTRATEALRSGELQLDSTPTQIAPPSPVRVRRPPGGASSVCLF